MKEDNSAPEFVAQLSSSCLYLHEVLWMASPCVIYNLDRDDNNIGGLCA